MNMMPLKTSLDIVQEATGLASSDALPIQSAVERILAGKEFGAADFADPAFRYEVARVLMERGAFSSVSEAQEFMDVLSANAAGQPIAPEMVSWLREHRALIVQMYRVAERAAIAQEQQAVLNKARMAVSRVEAALEFERQRAERYASVQEIGQKNYIAQYASATTIIPRHQRQLRTAMRF